MNTKHPSELKPRPDNVEELRSLSSVQAARALPKPENKPRGAGTDEGPKHHNPFKGMKI